MISSVFPAVLTDTVEESADFYRAMLGFETLFEVEWYVQLQAPDRPSMQIGVVARTHGSVPADHQELPAGVLISVEVDDVDEVHRRVMAAGHPELLPLRDEEWGQRHFITQDPAGVMVDVITPIEPSPEFMAAYNVGSDA